MFSFAAFLGARASVSGPVLGALVATAAIFLPGFLLAAGCLPLWNSVASKPWAAAAVAGVNAAVVGLLAAALYDPVWTGAVVGPFDVVIALACLALMATGRVSALVVVGICVAASVGVGLV